MVVIGLTQQVDTDAELIALSESSLTDQVIKWHNGLNCAVMYREKAGSGDFAPHDQTDNFGFWVCDLTLKGYSLEEYRSLRISEIDEKTGYLIYLGFVFDSNTFSLSVHAQVNWEDILSHPDKYEFPLPISTLDNNEYHLKESDVDSFVDAARQTKKGHLDSGRIIRKQIKEAVDEQAIESVIDNR